MRIPHVGGTRNTFGNRGPDRLGPTQFDTRGMDAEARGLADMAQGLGRAAGILQQQQRQDQADAEELARARGANAALDFEAKVQAKTRDLEARRLDGTLSVDEYEETAKLELDEIEAPAVSGLTAPDQERLNGGITRLRMGAMEGVHTTVRSARRDALKGEIGLLGDNLAKSASDPSADPAKALEQHRALEGAYTRAGMGGNFAKDHQAFADRWYYDNAKAWLVKLRDDPAGLAALEQSITGEQGRFAGKLDAEKQNSLVAQIQVRRDQLEAKTARDSDRLEAGADRALATVEKYVAEGIVPPIEELEKLRAKVKGSTREGEWDGMVGGMVEAQKIAALPPDQQLAYVEQMEAKLGGRLTLAQKRNIETTRSNYEQRKKELREDPLGYDAKVQGYTVPPLDLEGLLTGDPSGMAAQIAGRMELAASARKRYGVAAGVSPLRPTEARVLGEVIDRQSPQGVTKLYGNLRRMFADDDAYLAVMAQVAPDSPVRAAAGALALTNEKAAQLVVTGEALLNPAKAKDQGGKGGAFPMPPPAQIETALGDLVGDAFAGRGPAFERALQVVRAGYAGAASTDGDVSGELDTKRLRNIVNATLGTPVERGGQTVIAPPGMDEDRFDEALEAAWNAAGKPEGAGTLDDYRLVQRGNGTYLLERGRKFLFGADGQPLLLRVGK